MRKLAIWGAARGDMIQQADSEASTLKDDFKACNRGWCFCYPDWSWKVTPPLGNSKMAKIY